LFFRGIFQIAFSAPFVWQNYSNSKAAREEFHLIGQSWEAVRVLALSSVLVFLGLAFLFLALDNISLSYALVIDRQSTLFNAIFAFLFLGEPWLPVEFIAAIISIIGVFFVAQPSAIFGGESNADEDGGGNYVLGFVFGILGAICSAANFTAIRALGTTVKMHWANVIFVQSIVISILSIPTIYASGNSFQTVTPQIGGFIIAGCLVGAAGQVIITIGNTSIYGLSANRFICFSDLTVHEPCVS
jgi:drug/metabolite transporter (DMT)-like permease